MKKLFTLLAFLPLAGNVSGQAITINAADMPVPASPYTMWDFTAIGAAPNPSAAASGTWDYSPYNDFTLSDTFFAETDAFFTGAGVDVYHKGGKSFNSFLGYDLYREYDFSSTDVKESGVNIPFQGFDISFSTGSSGDSLIIPAQKSLFTSATTVLHFPFTAGSSWHSVSRRVTNFELTVAAYSLSHEPSTHVYYVHRDDSIVGWGKMRVYTNAGPSKAYDVLMDKIAQYAEDSFYLSGVAAPSAMLSAFMISQAQKTDSNYRYNFYRKGSYNYLLSYYYGNEGTYSTPQGRYSDSAVITADAGAGTIDRGVFTTVLYPNPGNGTELNLMVMGPVTLTNYSITDATGRVVASGSAEVKGGILHINPSLGSGNYLLMAGNGLNPALVKESFVVSK